MESAVKDEAVAREMLAQDATQLAAEKEEQLGIIPKRTESAALSCCDSLVSSICKAFEQVPAV